MQIITNVRDFCLSSINATTFFLLWLLNNVDQRCAKHYKLRNNSCLRKSNFYDQPKNELGINLNGFTHRMFWICVVQIQKTQRLSMPSTNDDKCATIQIQRLRGLITKRMSPSSTTLHNWEHFSYIIFAFVWLRYTYMGC